MKQHERAFTVTDLLALIAIMLVLAYFFGIASGPMGNTAKSRQAGVAISTLETAIDKYRADTGLYPPVDGPSGTTANLCDYLINTEHGDRSKPGYIRGWAGPYMEFKQGEVDDKGHIVDPWGVSYWYNSYNPSHNRHGFDLWSCGPDKKNGFGDSSMPEGKDDIKNWQDEKPRI